MALKLMAELGLDGSGFERGLSRLSGSLKGRIAGLFTVAAITSTVGRIKDLSEQFNVTTEEMQRLDFAAKQNSLSFEDVGTSLVRLGNARRNAAQGNEKLVETFKRFGISLADLNNPALRNVDILNKLSDAVVGMDLTARDRTELNDMLGRMGEKLEIVLRDARQLEGLEIINDDQITRIDRAAKAMEKLAKNATNWLANMVGTGIEKIQKFVENIGAAFILEDQGIRPEEAWKMVMADEAAQQAKEQEAEAIRKSKAGPKGPLFSAKEEAARKVSPLPAGDAMVRVGNFLGTGRNSINRIGERTNELLMKIEQNTRSGSVTNGGGNDEFYDG